MVKLPPRVMGKFLNNPIYKNTSLPPEMRAKYLEKALGLKPKNLQKQSLFAKFSNFIKSIFKTSGERGDVLNAKELITKGWFRKQ